MKDLSLSINILLIPLCITLAAGWQGEKINRVRYQEKFVQSVNAGIYFMELSDSLKSIYEPQIVQFVAYQLHVKKHQDKVDSFYRAANYRGASANLFPRSKEYQLFKKYGGVK